MRSSESGSPPHGNDIKVWRQFWSTDPRHKGQVIICGIWSLSRSVVINEGESIFSQTQEKGTCITECKLMICLIMQRSIYNYILKVPVLHWISWLQTFRRINWSVTDTIKARQSFSASWSMCIQIVLVTPAGSFTSRWCPCHGWLTCSLWHEPTVDSVASELCQMHITQHNDLTGKSSSVQGSVNWVCVMFFTSRNMIVECAMFLFHVAGQSDCLLTYVCMEPMYVYLLKGP